MRRDDQRLDDIDAAFVAIRNHLSRGTINDDLVFDAVRIRLVEIGEAVKGISDALLDSEPDIPWRQVAGMRDRLAHRYFDSSRRVVQNTVDNDLADLAAAVGRMRSRSATADDSRDV